MKKVMIFGVMLVLLAAVTAQAGENCTAAKKKAVCSHDVVKAKVDWACNLVETEGLGAVSKIKAMRYDCCGEPDYVWINDMHPTMIMHPIKPMLDWKDLSTFKDPKGKALFVKFVKAVKKHPKGAWVKYQWTKFGEKKPTNKQSWVKGCKVKGTGEEWVVGSGTWR